MPDDNLTDPLVEVAEQLEGEQAELGERAAELIFATLPSYAGVEESLVHVSVAKNTARAIATLVSRNPPAPGTSAEAAMTTRERLRQGVPIQDVIRGYRISLRVIHDRFIELASAREMPADRILEYSNLLWDVGDWFTASAAEEYRNHEVRSAVRDSVRQVEVFRELLAGDLTESQVRTAASALALDPAAEYAVFRMAPGPTGSVDVLRSRVDALRPRPELLTESGRDGWIGLTSVPRPLARLDHVVAVGPTVPLARLVESADIATRVLALVGGEPAGVYTLDDVSWRLATDTSPVVTDRLRARYVTPVREQGEFGDLLLETVRAFLAADLNVNRAAAALTVHPNTLRYRIARYEELVAARTTELNTAVELAWVLGLPVTPAAGADR